PPDCKKQHMRLMKKSEPANIVTVADVIPEKKVSKKKDLTVKKKMIARDVNWLSFNARVLQEAADPTVPLRERIRFLGIFSNNLDEFFRVRVATLKRMLSFGRSAKVHLEENPGQILDDIQQ